MPKQNFLELTIVGDKDKKLFIPTHSVLTYEHVPEGKNPNFEGEGTFLRYDFGQGAMFALVKEKFNGIKEWIGTEGFIQLNLLDDAELQLREHLITAIHEREHEDIELTEISLPLNGQVTSLFVKNSLKDIRAKQSI